MSRKTQITLSDRQHALLIEEANRSGVSMAELVRRAVDATYRSNATPRVGGFEVNLGLWRERDPALLGRVRVPRRRLRLDERDV